MSGVRQATIDILSGGMGAPPVAGSIPRPAADRGRLGSTCSFCGQELASAGQYLVAPEAVICRRCITFAADVVQRSEPGVRALRLAPDVVGDPPDDDAVAAIVATARTAFSDASDNATRAAAIEDGERLGPLYEQACVINIGGDPWVERIRFIRPDVADVQVVMFLGDLATSVGPGFSGPVVRLQGEWKVGRELTCSIIRFAGLECPPV